jgi:hypothetical protein
MTAVEEIRAAIEKLTELKNMSTQPDATGSSDVATCFNRHDAELIVTLHRTIDAQLAILRHVAEHYRGDLGIGTNRYVVALARAINGEATA